MFLKSLPGILYLTEKRYLGGGGGCRVEFCPGDFVRGFLFRGLCTDTR